MTIYDDAMRVGHRVRARLRAYTPGGYVFEGRWHRMAPGWKMVLYDTKTGMVLYEVDHSYWTNLSIAIEEASLLVSTFRCAGFLGLPGSSSDSLEFHLL